MDVGFPQLEGYSARSSDHYFFVLKDSERDLSSVLNILPLTYSTDVKGFDERFSSLDLLSRYIEYLRIVSSLAT